MATLAAFHRPPFTPFNLSSNFSLSSLQCSSPERCAMIFTISKKFLSLSLLCQRDKRNPGHHKHGSSQPVDPVTHRTGTRPTQGVQNPAAPSGWSRPPGSARATYPPQDDLAQQGNAIQQQEGDLARAEDVPFLGGFILPNNSNNNLSTSPNALTPSSSVVSLPNGSAQQGPPVVPPNVDKDE